MTFEKLLLATFAADTTAVLVFVFLTRPVSVPDFRPLLNCLISEIFTPYEVLFSGFS